MAKPTELDGVNSRTSVRKAAHRLIAARLADVRRYERALSNGISEEAIHDMRVAAHRLRVALFVFGGRNASKLERKVKRLQDALGEIRDLQVQLGWLEKQKNLADAEGIRMLLAELRATLLDREHDLRTALEEWTGNSAPKLETAGQASLANDGRIVEPADHSQVPDPGEAASLRGRASKRGSG